jgi:hypothetical protein
VNESVTGIPPAPFLLFFIAVWLLVSALIALLGGWTSLAASYPAPDEFQVPLDRRFRFRSIQVRRNWWWPAQYSNVMTIGLAPDGVYLAPFLLLRFLHKPLLIPWSAIADCSGDSFLWVRWVDVTLREDGPAIRLYGDPGEAVWGEWRVRGRR